MLGRIAISFLMVLAARGAPVRMKELASIEGVRDNQLLGYGLVVGLAGTGDKRQTVFSAQSLTNMLERMGVSVPPSAILVRNTAAVMVTANLPPYARPGARIDVTVAAIGDSSNLQGGLLLLTPLRAADGQVFVAAQGQVVTGGFVAGKGGNSQTISHPTAGRVPAGGIIERAAPAPPQSREIRLQLHRADFTTAARAAAAINQKFAKDGTAIARAETAGAIAVSAPPSWSGRPVEFLAEIEAVTVEADARSRIVINERTGTVVLGRDIGIHAAAILHGNLTVEIQTQIAVSQPAPLSQGNTTVVPQTGVAAKQDKARSVALRDGATVDDLVRALMAIGSTPRDIIAILQNLRAAGALEADLEVI